ncbi:ABC transporter permease [Dactylosporangium sp. NPDC048998]|uniref:ABC transporter permease n=1 Tax=Dactylosporangium sp. NPDC048998 TaxID=3363976 RepID=UPI00370FC008
MSGLLGLALADFRERVRRPAYLLMLISAIGLGLLAVPPADSHWSVLVIGGFRGRYTSDYVGMVTALTSALWLTLVGFYLVRDAVARDERTGVGQLLAASPLRTPVYLAGKLLSNAMVLGSMVAVLAATALVLQLLRGESRAVDPVALALPFALVALPMLVLTAALAVLFETTPVLRGGLGNVLWFFVWMIGAIGGQSAHAPFGGLGLRPVTLPAGASHDVGLGLMYVEEPLRTFDWPGLRLDAGFLGGRLALTAIAVAVALLPALWFHRFDRPARAARAAAGAEPRTVYKGLPPTEPRRGGTGPRLLAGEVRILVRGAPTWWWLGAGALALAGLAAPPGAVLALVWIWPVLLWSRLGTQPAASGADAILAACPAPRRRVVAEWGAGALLAAVTGAGAAARMAFAGDLPGLAAWTAGAAFIPALALALGALTGAPRVFQAIYTVLWYLLINDTSALDFMGALRDHGRLTGPSPALWAGAAAAGIAVALTRTAWRETRR